MLCFLDFTVASHNQATHRQLGRETAAQHLEATHRYTHGRPLSSPRGREGPNDALITQLETREGYVMSDSGRPVAFLPQATSPPPGHLPSSSVLSPSPPPLPPRSPPQTAANVNTAPSYRQESSATPLFLTFPVGEPAGGLSVSDLSRYFRQVGFPYHSAGKCCCFSCSPSPLVFCRVPGCLRAAPA